MDVPGQEWWLAVWICCPSQVFYSGLGQVEETVAEGLRRLQVGGAIEQMPTAAVFINPRSELVESILGELEILRSIAEAHDPACDDDSGDEEEPEPPISNGEALQHLHVLMRYEEGQGWVEADKVLLRLLRTYERERSLLAI
ncbi:hypothetical protein BJ878DRAFT_541910 [Calycina marina]|uniref:Uncharacterized protein n=1 Tax=Calycina marina TaxID=1763456 RepID=A0A9P8CF65_9HELO|nr:hypothetical protein BJ878DRAFT_541910 [Calycina marina]